MFDVVYEAHKHLSRRGPVGGRGSVARARGISRAELIRQLIDSGLSGTGSADLEADLSAIAESFGILSDSGDFLARGDDDRARHLDRVARLAKTR